MSDVLSHEKNKTTTKELPGAYLKRLRLKLQEERPELTEEYVSKRLNLRLDVITSLERDAYEGLPEPVFVKGYLRAYAKNILDIDAGPLIDAYNDIIPADQKNEKLLWQSERVKPTSQKIVHWVTGGFVIVVIAIVGLWWDKYKDIKPLNSIVENNATLQTPTKLVKKEKKSVKVNPKDIAKLQETLSLEPNASLVGEGNAG